MLLFSYLKSTILSKVVMAVTGVLLVLFLLGHGIGNMQVFLGKEVYNNYAHFLQSLGELLWVIRAVLLLSLIFHIITSVRLKFYNNSAKPVKYRIKRYMKAKLTSRTMIWTGIMVFAFLVYHLLHLTLGVTNPDHFDYNEYYAVKAYSIADDATRNQVIESGQISIQAQPVVYERHDVYKMVILGFRDPWISLAYIIGVILLGFHLNHAIQSMFQTLGLNHTTYNGFFRKLGPVLSTILVLCYISIPITIFLGLVGAGV